MSQPEEHSVAAKLSDVEVRAGWLEFSEPLGTIEPGVGVNCWKLRETVALVVVVVVVFEVGVSFLLENVSMKERSSSEIRAVGEGLSRALKGVGGGMAAKVVGGSRE